ncbi:sensor histidine kinase [Microterricola pindariensis]|uniref:histidine kinase n=1 Tax=Microterricola pindariensis TaxID=478010 RepID=A0ABX5AT67_9MICO|nr:HAMP domain-containing sensor histidine kinase [Microterricola pindariensis]PPL16140.1 hypothetical protein GY24_13205 [Microterricola pindariensis]
MTQAPATAGAPARPVAGPSPLDALRAPLTLRRRLLLGVIALFVLITMIVGLVSVAALHGSLLDRLDAQLFSAADRGRIGISGGPPPGGTLPGRNDASLVLSVPGQPVGTIGAVLLGESVQSAGRISETGGVLEVSDAQRAALLTVAADGTPHTVDLPGLGDYRAIVSPQGPAIGFVIALPLATVEGTSAQLGLIIAIVALFGVAIAVLAGRRLIDSALAPLERVTQLASRVSELPLDRGEVALAERVPSGDADERTEVGQLGAAFNRMLGHVASALTAREASERKVRHFVADASHELRTPLAAIRGYAELTRRSPEALPPDAAHALARIESESRRMGALVEDLLLLARLDEGRALESLPVDLTALAVDALGDAQVTGPDHEWGADLDEEPVVVQGDASRLQMVVVNLLANARVHTPPGTTVELGLHRVGDQAVLTVSDDGPGVDPEVQGSVFERFVRGDPSRFRAGQDGPEAVAAPGTGLGLATVRAVVAAHGGTVALQSEPGRTVFTVTVPLAP